MNNNQIIAQNILKVIGSMSRLSVMIGAKDFVAIDNGLQFGLKRASKGINKIIIKLNSLDLYDIELGNYSSRKLEYKTKKVINGVYFDQLKAILEEETGLYFSL